VISDVMMPVCDGYEMCRILRDDARTSHIPIILLTAKSDAESRLAGLERGANDYLTKPFDAHELLLRVRNLLALQEATARRYSGQDSFRLAPQEYVSRDRKFLEDLVSFVEERIREENLSIEELYTHAGMSRSQFHRKLKALTELSPSRFIRRIRLQRGKEMLEQGAGNVAEVAYAVGFGSQAYFSTCFKEEFGVSPGQVKHAGQEGRERG
jgi:AraC-like DNA-binding protein